MSWRHATHSPPEPGNYQLTPRRTRLGGARRGARWRVVGRIGSTPRAGRRDYPHRANEARRPACREAVHGSRRQGEQLADTVGPPLARKGTSTRMLGNTRRRRRTREGRRRLSL